MGIATVKTTHTIRVVLIPTERSTVNSWSLFSLPSPIMTEIYKAIAINTSNEISVLRNTSLKSATIPSDSVTAPASNLALLKLANNPARISMTTAKGKYSFFNFLIAIPPIEGRLLCLHQFPHKDHPVQSLVS